MASRANSNGITGCMTLLECWIYAYFPTLRPSLSSDWRDDDDKPWAMRWVRSTAQQHDYDSLENYRKHLDALGARNVDWLPYGRDMVNVHSGRTWYRGTIQFMGVNEPYMPERCLRQYGYIQGKPPHPIRPIQKSERRGKCPPYTCVYPAMYSVWDSIQGGLPRPAYTATRAMLHACDQDYLDWYTKHSHPKILNPEKYNNTFIPRLDPALLLTEANELGRNYYPSNRSWNWHYFRHGMPEEERRVIEQEIDKMLNTLSIWDSYSHQYGGS